MEKSTTAKKSSKASSSKTTSGKTTASRSKANAGATDESMLSEFFYDELKDIYWAEKHLVKTLPKMQKAATTEELKQAFQEHLDVTNEQVSRLEQVFEMLEKKAQGKKCEAMEGITKEGEGVIQETEKGSATRDVALIMAGQKVEHYEIATYGGLVQLAKTLGKNEIADLLQQTLDEEKEADQMLTQIAENNINIQASEEGEEGSMEGAGTAMKGKGKKAMSNEEMDEDE